MATINHPDDMFTDAEEPAECPCCHEVEDCPCSFETDEYGYQCLEHEVAL